MGNEWGIESEENAGSLGHNRIEYQYQTNEDAGEGSPSNIWLPKGPFQGTLGNEVAKAHDEEGGEEERVNHAMNREGLVVVAKEGDLPIRKGLHEEGGTAEGLEGPQEDTDEQSRQGRQDVGAN
jgi:hypothetical protein